MAKRKNQRNINIKRDSTFSTPQKSISLSNSKFKPDLAVNSHSQPLKWLVRGGALTTLIVWFSINDPFNSPKSWVLSITGFWLLGWLIFNAKEFIQNPVTRTTTFLATTFFTTLVVAWLATDNKFIGFFGQYGRKTGLLEYTCLIVFFLSAVFLIRSDSVRLLERALVFMGLVLGIYGFFQHFKIDFVSWHYTYNSVLGTLGNPDFSSAMMAILLVVNFGTLVRLNGWNWFRRIAAINVPLLTVVIIFSQARQGLLAAGLGVGIISLVWIHQRKKHLAIGLTAVALLGGIGVIAGLLKIGPLTQYFYKISVTYRGDYWRAALRMFTHHPLFGVGLDRYGANFRQYRDAIQTVRRGPLVVADAAHNVPLQLAATGGIFVLIAFVALTGFTLWRGIRTIRLTVGGERIVVTIFFAAWITYQAQSLISIDNIGIAVWGYILGGSVIGLSILSEKKIRRESRSSIVQQLTSCSLALIFLIISFLFFQSESDLHTLSAIIPPRNSSQVNEYENFVNRPLSHLFIDPAFQLIAAKDYKLGGDLSKAIYTYKKLLVDDVRNVDALSQLSAIYNVQKDWPATIALNKRIVKLDPFNQGALLELARAYKRSGDLQDANKLLPSIIALDPSSVEAKQARTELGHTS